MELFTQVKTLNFFKKLLLGETDTLSLADAAAQKPPSPVYSGARLPRRAPEEMGVSTSEIHSFFEKLSSSQSTGAHCAIFAVKGNVIAEAGFAPYSTARWHVTHSMCKSLTGTAIGILCDEGLLDLNEKICDIFSDKCTLLTSRRIRQLTVEHLLTMGSGVQFKELGAAVETDWVRAFIEADVSFEAGTQFEYNSMNSYMLSAIVSRKTNMTMYNFLRQRLFEPLGFGEIAWESCPMGITKGGWGMYVFLEDLVKLGQLYMQNGVWNGKQIISSEWVQKAISPLKMRETGEEYGYHVWVNSSNNSFMFNGMFGQYVAVFPDKQLIIAINSGSGHLFTQGTAYSAMCEFYNNFQENAVLDVNAAARERFDKYIASLCFINGAYPVNNRQGSWLKRFFHQKQLVSALPVKCNKLIGKSYTFKKNRTGLLPIILQSICGSYSTGINAIAFERSADKLYLLWHEGAAAVRIPLCFTKPAIEQINLNGFIWDIGTTAVFKTNEDDLDVLKISVSFLESSSTRLIKIMFEDNNLILKLDESPAIAVAMEKIHSERIALKNIDPAFFKDIDFIEYQFNRICAPTLKGVPQ